MQELDGADPTSKERFGLWLQPEELRLLFGGEKIVPVVDWLVSDADLRDIAKGL